MVSNRHQAMSDQKESRQLSKIIKDFAIIELQLIALNCFELLCDMVCFSADAVLALRLHAALWRAPTLLAENGLHGNLEGRVIEKPS